MLCFSWLIINSSFNILDNSGHYTPFFLAPLNRFEGHLGYVFWWCLITLAKINWNTFEDPVNNTKVLETNFYFANNIFFWESHLFFVIFAWKSWTDTLNFEITKFNVNEDSVRFWSFVILMSCNQRLGLCFG